MAAVGVVTALEQSQIFEPGNAFTNMLGLNRAALIGECTGTVEAFPVRGYEGEPQDLLVRIDPPFDDIIVRVITDNPACKQCEAERAEPGLFVRPGHFVGDGPFRATFVALDGDGNERCRGESVALEALGPAP